MPRRTRDIFGFFGFLALCLSVAALGGAVTQTSVHGWYRQLAKPTFTPPDWLFTPVWTVLYVLMAVSAWLVWRSGEPRRLKEPLIAFGIQLALNLAWSFVFFGAQSIGWALAEIGFLWISIAITLSMFWRTNRFAGWLFVPYLTWVSYAAVLNAAIFILN